MLQKAHLFLAALGAVLLASSDLAVLGATERARGFFMDSPPERIEIDPSVLNTTLDQLRLYESSGGQQTRTVEKVGGTVGEYHITQIAKDDLALNGIDISGMSEREIASSYVQLQRNKMIEGGIAFDSLLPREQIAALTNTYNAGLKGGTKSFRRSLKRLADARKNNAGKDEIDRLVQGTVGFFDLMRSGGKYKPGLMRRSISQQSVFLTGQVQFGDLEDESKAKQFIRNRRNESVKIDDMITAQESLK